MHEAEAASMCVALAEADSASVWRRGECEGSRARGCAKAVQSVVDANMLVHLILQLCNFFEVNSQ